MGVLIGEGLICLLCFGYNKWHNYCVTINTVFRTNVIGYIETVFVIQSIGLAGAIATVFRHLRQI